LLIYIHGLDNLGRLSMYTNLARLLATRSAKPSPQPWTTCKADRPRCGAKTRRGHPCRAPAVWDYEDDRPVNGRCRMHGGLSTGAKTAAGRLRQLANLKQNRGKREELLELAGQLQEMVAE
jgi:hypothetical protein